MTQRVNGSNLRLVGSTPATDTPAPTPPELRPKAGVWEGRPNVPPQLREHHGPALLAGSYWLGPNSLIVLSLLLEVEDPATTEMRAEWHISIAQGPVQPQRSVARQVLRDFGVLGAAVEIRQAGLGRHYVVKCDAPQIATPTQPAVEHVSFVDASGARWSNFAGAEWCDGCAYAARTETMCVLHRRTT